MVSLMIIDDEVIIRRGIKTSIDWESYGIQIIAEAGNGKDALEKAIKIKPDIAIVDVRMPIMDGLEFSRLILKEQPNLKIIILSGYEDFSYAKEAISIGVYRYLLKPFGAEELTNVVLELKEQILDEKLKSKDNEYTKELLNESLPLIQSKFISNIIKGVFHDENIIVEKAAALKISLYGPLYQVVIIDIDDYFLITEDMSEQEKDSFVTSILTPLDEIFEEKKLGIVRQSEFDYFIGVVNLANGDSTIIFDLCCEIQTCLKRYLKVSASIGLGNIYCRIKDISKSYYEALTAMRYKIFAGKNSVLDINKIKVKDEKVVAFYPTEEEKQLLNYMKIMDRDKLQIVIDKIFERLEYPLSTYDDIKRICIRIIMIAISNLEEMGVNVQYYLGAKFEPYIEIQKYETFDDIKDWISHLFNIFIDIIKEDKNVKYQQIVKKAIDYIAQNYSNNITVADIANVVFVTPNYFSKVFKEEMGENFTEWLNKFRIEKSKALLKEVGIKTYEIAEKVGYNDYKYFSYNFKKYVGCTPREYKNS